MAEAIVALFIVKAFSTDNLNTLSIKEELHTLSKTKLKLAYHAMVIPLDNFDTCRI